MAKETAVQVINIHKSKSEEEKIYRFNKILAKLICRLGSTEYYKITMKKNT